MSEWDRDKADFEKKEWPIIVAKMKEYEQDLPIVDKMIKYFSYFLLIVFGLQMVLSFCMDLIQIVKIHQAFGWNFQTYNLTFVVTANSSITRAVLVFFISALSPNECKGILSPDQIAADRRSRPLSQLKIKMLKVSFGA